MLDNCEHVIDGAAALAEGLLSGAPDVHTIATSRELLDVAGEAVALGDAARRAGG